jgi:hypothetical protein
MPAGGLSWGPAILPPFPPCLAGHNGRSRWTESAAPYFFAERPSVMRGALMGNDYLLFSPKKPMAGTRPGHDAFRLQKL